MALKRGSRDQISHTIEPHLLAKVDALAAEMGQSRAGIINTAIYEYIGRQQALQLQQRAPRIPEIPE